MATVESYYRELANRQERELRKLYIKALRILELFGVREGTAALHNEEMVATMYLGEERIQIRQPLDRKLAPIRLLKGGSGSLQPEEPTDIDEGGEPRTTVELAQLSLSADSGSIVGTKIMGEPAEPHKKYIWELPELEIYLGLWDQFLNGTQNTKTTA